MSLRELFESKRAVVSFINKGPKIGEEDLWAVVEDEDQTFMTVSDLKEMGKTISFIGEVRNDKDKEYFIAYIIKQFPSLKNNLVVKG